MDLLSKINDENGSLNDLYYVLLTNGKSFLDLETTATSTLLTYPNPVTVLVVPNLSDTVVPTTQTVKVVAYQSILDVCVRYYGTLDNLPKLLNDNSLTYDSYLQPGQQLVLRRTDMTSKATQTLEAIGAVVTNYDRELPANRDIYLGTEDGDCIGPTTSIKIKVKL